VIIANSKDITIYKDIILKTICSDYELIRLIDTDYVNVPNKIVIHPEELIHKKIFPYYYNPSTISEVISYIMIKVDIIKSKGELIKEMLINITSVSNQSIMKVPFGFGTRIDQMGGCVDRLFNASDKLGFGYLELVSSREWNIDDKHRGRELTFKVDEFNISRCNNER
jgi:hypothetical protein